MKKVYLEPVSNSVQLLAATGMLAGVSGPFAGVDDNKVTEGYIPVEGAR